MVSKVPKIKAPMANRPRNAFDLSQRHLFTAHAGMLLPVLSLDLIPHDHVEINASDFVRTMPMNTAAYASMRGVYEFFYVPYHQLYPQFDQFITGMTDFHSAAIKDLMGTGFHSSGLPNFNLQELFVALTAIQDLPYVDIMGYDRVSGSERLLDLLGYGRYRKTNGSQYSGTEVDPLNALNTNFNVTPFRACAYQKIYQDYYRNTQYETFNIDCFNLDKYKGVVSPQTLESNEVFMLRYRNAQQDYLSNVRPSQLFTSGLPTDPFKNLPIPTGEYVTPLSNGTNINPLFVVEDNEVNLNVNSIRSAFAVDKLLRITTQAGKTFQDQIKAHYGVEIPDSRDGKVQYLGGFDSDIQLSDVTQTSGSTSTTPETAGYLGKLTSKGTGSGSGRIVYDAKEHGILMCIYSLVPMAAYDCTRIDPMLLKTNRFDFFTPEFENLGLQPLPIKTISTFTGDAHVNDILGYQPRYSEYKTALDINHGQFGYKDALSYYTSSRFRENSQYPVGGIDQFKVDPRWLDKMFVASYNGTELTDCIYGGANFNIIKVSDMSEDGMPRV